MEYDFQVCKFCGAPGCLPRYRIGNGNRIYCCPSCGAHYIDYLDDVSEALDCELPGDRTIAKAEYDYIDKLLQGSKARFAEKVDILRQYCSLERCLVVSSWN